MLLYPAHLSFIYWCRIVQNKVRSASPAASSSVSIRLQCHRLSPSPQNVLFVPIDFVFSCVLPPSPAPRVPHLCVFLSRVCDPFHAWDQNVTPAPRSRSTQKNIRRVAFRSRAIKSIILRLPHNNELKVLLRTRASPPPPPPSVHSLAAPARPAPDSPSPPSRSSLSV